MLTPTKLTSETTPPGSVLMSSSRSSDTSAMKTFSGRTPTQTRPGLDTGPSAGRGDLGALDVDDEAVAVDAGDVAGDQVGLTEEVGHERRPRVLVQVRRSTHLLDDALVHHRDVVGHRHGFFLIVRDVHEGEPDLDLDPLELDLHLSPQLEVERAQRLVEQQHLGLVDQRPAERDPLLLTTRELGRLLVALAR